jgi:hypothetical protein
MWMQVCDGLGSSQAGDASVDLFAQLLTNGIINGATYALIATGIT